MARGTVIFQTATPIMKVAKQQLENQHRRLRDKPIYWHFTSDTPTNTKAFAHDIKQKSDFDAYLAQGRFARRAIHIIISESNWNTWSEDRQAAEVDIALTRIEDGKNALQVKSFLPVSDLAEIIGRHGLFSPDVQAFAKRIQQLALDFGDNAQVGSEPTGDPEDGDLEYSADTTTILQEVGIAPPEAEAEPLAAVAEIEDMPVQLSDAYAEEPGDLSITDKLAPADPAEDAAINDALRGRTKRPARGARRFAETAAQVGN